MSIGKIGEYNVQAGNWLAYIERVEMYFIANKIGDDVKLPTLISLMGEETYELLSSLASPSKPSSLKYEEIVALLQEHLQPRPAEMAERFRFRQRRQLAGESIADYIVELKKLSRFCNFKTVLEDNLRDQFVCGLKSEFTRQRLFAEDHLSYPKAVTLATTLEAAERDACAVEYVGSEMKNAAELSGDINKLQVNSCTACGSTSHRKWDCKYKKIECSLCHKIGHLRRMCSIQSHTAAERPIRSTDASKIEDDQQNATSRGGRGGRGGRTARGGALRRRVAGQQPGAYWVQEAEEADSNCSIISSRDDNVSDEDLNEPMYQMSLSKYKPVSKLAPIKKFGAGPTGKSGAGSLGKSGAGVLGKSGTSGFGKSYGGKISSGKSSSSAPKLPSGLGSSSAGNSSGFGASSSKSYGVSSLSTPKNKSNKTGFGIIWIPTRKNKKKEVVYSGVNDKYPKGKYERSPSMYRTMSGDSPDFQPHKKKEEETDLLMPEKTKAPAASIAAAGTALGASELPSDSTATENAEEKQEFIRHDKKEDSKEAAGDTNNKEFKSEKSEDFLENDKVTNKPEKEDKDTEKFGDKVDSVYLRPPPPQKTRSATSTEEEEDCGIKCLYYTIQCCDCVLM